MNRETCERIERTETLSNFDLSRIEGLRRNAAQRGHGLFATDRLHGDHYRSRLRVGTPGTALLYSTYLGGSDNDLGNRIVVDASGNAVVVGELGAGSTNFPTVSPIQGAEDWLFDSCTMHA